MKLKNFIAYFLLLCLSVTLLASCSDDSDGKVDFFVLKGPTGIGAVNLFEGHDDYRLKVVDTPDLLTATVLRGEYDVAALPINLAATLYQKSEGELQIVALNTLSVLYIVDAGDTVHSLEDLEGKTIRATGQGSTPEYILSALLDAADINCTVEYVADGAALAATVVEGDGICLLPQPNVTSAIVSSGARIAIDIAEEWAKYFDTEIIQGCIVVRRDFAEKEPELLAQFLADYKASIESVNSVVDAAAALCEKHQIIPKAAIAKKAIPDCNIVYVDGDEMAERTAGFLEFLYEKNPASVGGKLPDESFYFKK